MISTVSDNRAGDDLGDETFVDRLLARAIRRLFGEIRAPQSDRFLRRLTVTVVVGVLCSVGAGAGILTRSLVNLSANSDRILRWMSYALEVGMVISFVVIPTVWMVRYGSRFRRSPPQRNPDVRSRD